MTSSPDVSEAAGRVPALLVTADCQTAHGRGVETGLLRDGGAELAPGEAAHQTGDAWYQG